MCFSIVPASANRGQLGLCVLPYFTPDLYWADTGKLVILVIVIVFLIFLKQYFWPGYVVLVQYRASTNKSVLARYRPSIGSVLGQYRMCGIGPILGQYKQIGTGPVSGLYWANTEKLFQYWASTVMFAG